MVALSRVSKISEVFEIEVLRLLRKNAQPSESELDFAVLCEKAAKLGPNDLVFTTFRGNAYNTLGMMKHPNSYDIVIPGFQLLDRHEYNEIIPYNLVKEYMDYVIRASTGGLALKIKGATSAVVSCLATPPPKEDAEHILRGAETAFRDAGIQDIGVAPALVRLKLWEMQHRALRNFCKRKELNYMPPPPICLDATGYLAREYYAKDATHANERYGSILIEQIKAFANQRPA